MIFPRPEADAKARLLANLEDALDSAERTGLESIASTIRVAITMLKPHVGEAELHDEADPGE